MMLPLKSKTAIMVFYWFSSFKNQAIKESSLETEADFSVVGSNECKSRLHSPTSGTAV